MKNSIFVFTILFSACIHSFSQDFKTKEYRSLNSKNNKIANVITVIYQDNGLATFSRSEAKANKEDASALIVDVSKENLTTNIPDKSTATVEFNDKSIIWFIPMEEPEKFYNLANKQEDINKFNAPMLIIEAKYLRFNSGN
jgi:hypothetical protein